MSNKQERTLIMLIDFEGHPSLGNDELNDTRWSYVRNLVFPSSSGLVRKPSILISSHDYDIHHQKIWELESMVKVEDEQGNGLCKWVTISPDDKVSIPDILNMVDNRDCVITPNTPLSPIIFGGCNTVGCVSISRAYSAIKWAKQGWYVQIILPMCADYQVEGTSTAERNTNAFVDLYNLVKQHDVVEYVDIVSKVSNQFDWFISDNEGKENG